MIVARISDATLATINGLEIVAIIYLAIAISRISERISRLEGRLDQRDHNHHEEGK